MKTYDKHIFLVLVLLFNSFFLSAQVQRNNNSLEVGDQCPDLNFHTLINSKTNSANLSDFKGKIVILDFWATWCAPCVGSLPALNELQKKFGDKIQVILVNQENIETAQKFITQRKEIGKIDFVLPSTILTPELQKYFPHYIIPHDVWIDGTGKVIAITDFSEVNEQNIDAIINKKSPLMNSKRDRQRLTSFDYGEPFGITKIRKPIYENEGKTEDGIPYKIQVTKGRIEGLTSGSTFATGRVLGTNVGKVSIFATAYAYNNTYAASSEHLSLTFNEIIYETQDRAILYPDQKLAHDSTYRADNFFCYEILFPTIYDRKKFDSKRKIDSNVNRKLYEVLKKECNLFTGYYGIMEPRETKVWVMKIIDTTKLNSGEIYEKTEFIPGNLGATLKNYPMYAFLRSMYLLWQHTPVFINETNYKGSFNFKIDAKLTDYEGLSKEFAKHGIELKEESRKIPLLIIKDK